MARVHHVKKARKNYKHAGIKKGESYYWWKFRYGGKNMSKTYPKPSQLTQSEFLGALYAMQEKISDFSCDTVDEFNSFKEEIIEEIDQLIDETQGKLDNMPDALQQAPTGELLQNRIDALEDWKSQIENIECSESEDDEFDESDAATAAISELQETSCDCE